MTPGVIKLNLLIRSLQHGIKSLYIILSGHQKLSGHQLTAEAAMGDGPAGCRTWKEQSTEAEPTMAVKYHVQRTEHTETECAGLRTV